MSAPLPTLVQPGFELTTAEVPDGLALRFSGTADMHAIETLDVYLGQIHAAAVDRQARRVQVDFRKLEFMNSSCFKSFVSWIGQVQDAVPTQRYQIEFQSDPRMHWQRRSLNALRCFAMDLVSIQT
ncbi:MAG: uncharacterized protein JWP97_4905 [Labilithrix sp.]|nr:uncharacterized protein [Labilithrix sp.]